MTTILAVYGTSYGQTRRIVERITGTLAGNGVHPVVWRGDQIPDRPALETFDGFLIAGSVIRGQHQRYVEEFVRRNLALLNTRPGAFVSVSGSAAANTPAKRDEARRLVEKFTASTGWHPSVTATFGGAINYTQYGFFTRWIMKEISRRSGGSTDTSRDHELTDWDAVDRFAERLATIFRRTEQRVTAIPGR